MSLTKAHITDNLFSKNLFTKTECAHIVDTVFELMKQALADGDEVMISGFGKFQVRRKTRRRGRNIQRGPRVRVAPRTVVTFKCSGVLKEKVNPGRK